MGRKLQKINTALPKYTGKTQTIISTVTLPGIYALGRLQFVIIGLNKHFIALCTNRQSEKIHRNNVIGFAVS